MKPSLETKPSSSIKTGDVIRLGDHILVCGDAAKIDLAALCPRPIDLVLTDPPYGVDYVASKRGIGHVSVDKDIANDGFATEMEYAAFSVSWLKPALPFLAEYNSLYIFNSDKMAWALMQALMDLKVKVGQVIVWVKSQPVMSRLDYLSQHEFIVYGWKGKHVFRRGKGKSVFFAPKPVRSKLHPTMKPISILRQIILNSTKTGGLVYDPFGGSGSTLIACEHTKRSCVMVEIDPDYCETIARRWEKLTGHGRELIR